MANNMIDQAADRLRKAAATHTPCSPVRELIGSEDIDTAYSIQNLNNGLREQAGARIVGRKIGLTSQAVQAQFGIRTPDYGALFDDMEIMNGLTVEWGVLLQPKVEAEIAFVLGKDLPYRSTGAADVLSAIEYALASIEIVGSRIANWDIKITDTIADNASASHFVLGHLPMPLRKLDLVNCQMVMSCNGDAVSTGNGGACMGSPVNAVVWLARTMAQRGTPLRAGDVVLSGALGPMAAVQPGDKVQAFIEGLGSVSVHFGPA